MNRRLLIAGALVALVVAPPVAHAAPIGYTIHFNFDGSSVLSPSEQDPILPTSGSFTYDASTQTFTNFHVVWNGFNFDMTLSANNPLLFFAPSCLNGLTGAAASFSLLSGSCNPAQGGGSTVWIVGRLQGGPTFEFISSDPLHGQNGTSAFIDINETDGGSPLALPSLGGWTITSQTAANPEPSTVWLAAFGAGLLAILRKRRSAPCRES